MGWILHNAMKTWVFRAVRRKYEKLGYKMNRNG